MRIKHLLLLLISINFYISCSSQKESQDLTDIYNLVIDKTVKPLPPPPPKSRDSSGMRKRVRDSLGAIKLKIAISNRLVLLNKQSFNISGYDSYHDVKENLVSNKNETLIIKDWFKTKKGHTINIINHSEINKYKIFEKYRAIASLSNVGFNSAKDKAIIILGVSYAPKLSETTIIYFLEKINGKWVIEHEKVISIS